MQVRQCYLHGTEKDGSAGKVVARMLNTAVSAGKRARSETSISKGEHDVMCTCVVLGGHPAGLAELGGRVALRVGRVVFSTHRRRSRFSGEHYHMLYEVHAICVGRGTHTRRFVAGTSRTVRSPGSNAITVPNESKQP